MSVKHKGIQHLNQTISKNLSYAFSIRVSGQIRLFSLYQEQQRRRSLQIHMCQCSLNQRAGIRPSQTAQLACWNKGAGLRDKGVHLLSVLEYLDLIFLGDNIIPVRFIPLISQHYWTPNMHFISCFHLIFNPLFLSLSFFPTPPILYLSCFFFLSFNEVQWCRCHIAVRRCCWLAECRKCCVSEPLLPAAVPFTADHFSAHSSRLHDEHSHTTETKRMKKRKDEEGYACETG